MEGYAKRSGNDGSGRDYEIKITGLLALRCALRRDTREVWLGSNLDEVGNFDDVVLFKRALDGTVTAFLMQLKHQDWPKNIKRKEFTSNARGASKDFYLAKYYEEYKKLKSKIEECNENETKIINDLREANKIVFVLYTNRGVNVCDLLEDFTDDCWKFLNTGANGTIYKFKGFPDYGTFLDDLYLFAGQAHLNDIDGLMTYEIKTVLDTDLFNNNDQSVFVKNFSAFLRLWAKNKKICQALTNTDVLNEITDLLLQDFKVGLSKESYKNYNCPTKLIWNQLLSEKVLTIVDYSETVLDFLKAYVGSELKDYCTTKTRSWSDLVEDASQLLSSQNVKIVDLRNNFTLLDVYKYLWFSNKVPLLLQVDTMDDYKNVLRILKLSDYTKRVIVVSKTSVVVDKPKTVNYFFSLEDLNQDQINRVIQTPIKLQGRGPIPLTNLIDESMHNLIKSQDVIGVLSGTFTIGDCFKELPKFFIERQIQDAPDLSHRIRRVDDEHSGVNVLSASPGMGKSVFLDYIAQNVSTNNWVLYLSLAEFDDESFHAVMDSALNHSECNSELSSRVYQKMKSTRNVVVLLDGFDEVLIKQQPAVLKFAKEVVDDGFSMWMTTRPSMRTTLEETFETVALTLVPFAVDDQRNFLTKYFGPISDAPEHQTILENFVNQLLNAAQRNLRDWNYEFTGIPLQTKLLADVFYFDCEQSIACGSVKFDQRFDLLFLYEQFVKKKLDIMSEKFGRTAVDMREQFERQQKLFALRTVFPQGYLQPLNVEQQLNEFLHNHKYNMQFMQRDGLLVFDSGTVKFVHRTFAEYLAAEWLSENINEDLIKLRFLSQYAFLFNLLDRILSRNNALHMAIVNAKTIEALKIIASKPELVERTDAWGRNVVHLIALYGFHHEFDGWYDTLVDPLLDVLKTIDNVDKLTRVPDKALSYTPLDYAVTVSSFAIADYLSQFNLAISGHVDDYRKKRIFHYCAMLDYTSLFRALLIYYSEREILDVRNIIKKTGRSKFLCSIDVNDNENNLCFPKSNIIHRNLFKYKFIEDETDVSDYYYDLRLASSFGTEDNVQYLLDKGLSVNQEDFDKNTSLHYACINGQLENVKVLLQNGAIINKVNVENNWELEIVLGSWREFCIFDYKLAVQLYFSGVKRVNKLKTPLHCAAKMGYSDILIELIKNGGEVNTTNYDNESPLFFATRFGRTEAALTLLSNGADVNLRNKKGQTVLLVAAKKGNTKLVREFVTRGADVNNVDINKNTPLTCALSNNYFDIAIVLWNSGAESNIRNNSGYCALDYIADASTNILLETLNYVDVNAKTMDGDTILHLALPKYEIDNVWALLEKGADVNSSNNSGSTPLHLASCLDNVKLLQVMIGNGAQINKRDNNGRTPLHLAVLYTFFNKDCKKLLLDVGVDVNATDNLGNTAWNYVTYSKSRVKDEFNSCDFKSVIQMLQDKGVVEDGAGVNKTNSHKESPLFYATREGDRNKVMLLLSQGADIGLRNIKGQTVLNIAAERGDAMLVEEFVARGADVNNFDVNKNTPLTCALLNNHFDVAKVLWESGAESEICDNKSNCALDYIAGASTDLLLEALKHVDVNARTTFGDTILHLSVAHERIDNVSALFENGADLNLPNNEGVTPLHQAADMANVELVQFLIDKGARVDLRDNNGRTSLHAAQRLAHLIKNSERVIKLLLDAGVEVNVEDNFGNTAMHYVNKKIYPFLVLFNNTLSDNFLDPNESFPVNYKTVPQLLVDYGAGVTG